MARPLVVGVAGAVAGVAGGAIVLLVLHGAPKDAVPAGGTSGPSSGGTVVEENGPSDLGPIVSREEKATREVELPTAVAEEIAAPLLEQLRRAYVVREALADAKAGKIDAVGLQIRLQPALVGHPELARPVLDELLAAKSPEMALKLAQSLAVVLDDADLRRQTVDALRAAPAETRAVGLLSLLGRDEKDAAALAVSCFREDAPDARAAAGFLLNNMPSGVPAADDGAVRDAARAAVRSRETPARVVEESLGLLGRSGATEEDLGLMERALLEGKEPAVRARAFGALVASGAPRARLKPTFERAAKDQTLPETLREAVKLYLASRN